MTFAMHTFVGSQYAVPPLTAPGVPLPMATIWLNYLCWHIVSGMLLILAFTLIAVATGRLHVDVALPIGLVFAWIGTWSIVTTMKGSIAFYRCPRVGSA